MWINCWSNHVASVRTEGTTRNYYLVYQAFQVDTIFVFSAGLRIIINIPWWQLDEPPSFSSPLAGGKIQFYYLSLFIDIELFVLGKNTRATCSLASPTKISNNDSTIFPSTNNTLRYNIDEHQQRNKEREREIKILLEVTRYALDTRSKNYIYIYIFQYITLYIPSI